jgi:hypothetical protein
MKDMRAMRANEKLKRASTLVGNGGLALLIASLSRWYSAGLATYVVTWILISAGLIWGSVQMNELLDSEDGA